jgi:hypothetical protein
LIQRRIPSGVQRLLSAARRDAPERLDEDVRELSRLADVVEHLYARAPLLRVPELVAAVSQLERKLGRGTSKRTSERTVRRAVVEVPAATEKRRRSDPS